MTKLERLQSELATAEDSQARMEVNYRKFLADTHGKDYFGMSGNTARLQHQRERDDYRAAWRKFDDEIRELNWLITNFKTLGA